MKVNNLGIYCDEHGNTYEVIEEVSQVVSRSLTGTPTTHDGTKGYRTSCGIPLNLKNGVFITLNNVSLKPLE